MDTKNKNASNELSRLLGYATSLQLSEYKKLSDQLLDQLTGPDLGEVYLSRAQIKLLTIDHTIEQDLQQADRLLPDGASHNLFFDHFTFSLSTIFFILPTEANSISLFLDALKKSDNSLRRLFGPQGYAIRQLMESEILYYTGKFQNSIDIAEQLQEEYDDGNNYDKLIIIKHVLLRSHLALGNTEDATQIMSSLIMDTKNACGSLDNPAYQTIRSWYNITTGWSGDTQRYHITPDFRTYPALEDRTDAIHNGIHQQQPTEIPFIQYAQSTTPNTYTMRQLYMDIYKMLLTFKYDTIDNALKIFDSIYTITESNNLTMPFAEYGYQIIPFLQCAIEQNAGQYSHKWLEQVIDASDQYENSLRKLREE